MQMTSGNELRASAAPAFAPFARPRALANAARHGARLYRRGRDLAGLVPGLAGTGGTALVQRLREAEARCEDQRRARAPGYRPSRHVLLLAAFLAEAAAACQPKASGSDCLRSAM